jgi:hypothetical protein
MAAILRAEAGTEPSLLGLSEVTFRVKAAACEVPLLGHFNHRLRTVLHYQKLQLSGARMLVPTQVLRADLLAWLNATDG